MVDWSLVQKFIREKEIQREFDKTNSVRHRTTKTLPLLKENWYLCTLCHGTKTYLEGGDAHRSEGMVPCFSCENDGMIRTYRKSVYRVKAKSERS